MSRWLLVLSGLLFLLYPVLRPWHDETTVDGARAAMGSTAWVLAHLVAMLGFVLVPIALLGLRERLGTTPTIVMWLGAGLVLPYYGAEDFGLFAAASHDSDLLAVAETLRYNAFAVTLFGIGLLALAVGAVLVAVKDRSAVLFAAGFVLFLPQFFTPAPMRIAHGVLMLVGLLWFAFKNTAAKPQHVPATGTSV
ncbi:hypothetical protein GCM10022247_04960 [Allokutzneria multivorans]|uniref:Uncharacterized protein n=1 Tax=Allokutzneria multivorans TaxID=1142134 RepID=A0ABP7QXU8_9PSEU